MADGAEAAIVVRWRGALGVVVYLSHMDKWGAIAHQISYYGNGPSTCFQKACLDTSRAVCTVYHVAMTFAKLDHA